MVRWTNTDGRGRGGWGSDLLMYHCSGGICGSIKSVTTVLSKITVVQRAGYFIQCMKCSATNTFHPLDSDLERLSIEFRK